MQAERIIQPGKTLPPRPERDPRKSFGTRRRYRGKMVNPGGSPRSHSGSKVSGGSPPFFEVGAGDQPSAVCGKSKGRRVSLPHGRVSFKGDFRAWADA